MAEYVLDECPFCDSSQPYVTYDIHNGSFCVECGNCGARGPWNASEDEAATDWGERAPALKWKRLSEHIPPTYTNVVFWLADEGLMHISLNEFTEWLENSPYDSANVYWTLFNVPVTRQAQES